MADNIFTKRFSAEAWFYFQKQAHVDTIDVEVVYVDGEKWMLATFRLLSN